MIVYMRVCIYIYIYVHVYVYIAARGAAGDWDLMVGAKRARIGDCTGRPASAATLCTVCVCVCIYIYI